MKRLTAYFEGRVQGVGFRFTARNVAADFDVTGFVRNLPDGRVEMVAEGDSDELDRLLTAVEIAMKGYIHSTSSHKTPPTGAFKSFDIAH